jgi:hypothetical protein
METEAPEARIVLADESSGGSPITVTDKHGHILDGDWDPKGKDGCDHRDTPEWKREHRKVHKIKKTVPQKVEKVEKEETKTVATVQVQTQEVKPPPKRLDLEASLPLITGAIAGMVGPMAANIAKGFLKNLLKGKLKGSEKAKEEGPTDCKTSQVRAAVRFNTIEGRISKLESKDSSDIQFGNNSLEELVERLEKLEKKVKKIK